MFEGIGLATEEEDLYLRLLATGSTSVRDLAREVQWGSPRVRSVLKVLESKGFVSRSPLPTEAYLPVAPDAAVEHLALRREEEIARARSIASQLATDFRLKLQRTDPAELVEVVVGAEAITQRVAQLQMSGRREVAAFSKPPYYQGSSGRSNPEELVLLARGVRWRMLYEAAGLELHESQRIQEDIEAGEEARVLGELPMKLVIVDDKIAVTTVAGLAPDKEPAALVLHAISVVRGLKLLFEFLWERAVPIGVAPTQEPTDGMSLEDGDRELLQLVAAGFKDEVIARQMDLDPRTVRRRLRRLMDALGAETRFQAGMQVVRQGLIE